MYEKKKYNYRSLINHHVAVASCFFSLLQLLLSVFILICGFTLLSGFCNDLVCQGITDALGLWIGFSVGYYLVELLIFLHLHSLRVLLVNFNKSSENRGFFFVTFETKCSRTDLVKFVEDSL